MERRRAAGASATSAWKEFTLLFWAVRTLSSAFFHQAGTSGFSFLLQIFTHLCIWRRFSCFCVCVLNFSSCLSFINLNLCFHHNRLEPCQSFSVLLIHLVLLRVRRNAFFLLKFNLLIAPPCFPSCPCPSSDRALHQWTRRDRKKGQWKNNTSPVPAFLNILKWQAGW